MIFITLSSIITALLVVTSTSTVYSVLWLVATFLIISTLLGFLNLGFTALLYIIVYVGAIAILFLFVVQLLDLGSASEQPIIQDADSKNLITGEVSVTNKSITPLVVIISIALLSILVIITYVSNINTDSLELNSIQSYYDVFTGSNIDINSFLTSKVETINSNLISPTSVISSTLGNTPQVLSIAEWFYGPGLLPLVIISIILLVAMIAPISLCKDND